MKITHSRARVFLLLPALLVSLCAFAQEAGQQERGGPREPESPLQKEMETINRDARKLSRQVNDPAKKDDTLKIIAEMQKSADTAKAMTPSRAEKLSGAEKTKYMDTYKKDMDALIKELAALKDAVDAGKGDQAKAELDKINKMKMSSHKELGVQMGGGPGGRGGPGGPGGRGGPGGAGGTGGAPGNPGGAGGPGGQRPMGQPPAGGAAPAQQ